MKKILLGALVLSMAIFTSCDSDIEADVPSVSDYNFISFEDDNVVFELNQDGSSTQTITVYNSRRSSSARTYNLQVLPAGFSDDYGTDISADAYSVPASVTIPANERSAQFDVTITDNGVASGQRLAIAFSNDTTAESPHPMNLNIVIVCPVNELILDINFDNFAEETSWELYDLTSGTVLIASGDGYDDLDGGSIQERICLEDGDYGFVIYDVYSDGICCAYGQGSYTLTLNGEVIKEGGSFGANEVTLFTP
ncbi:hypothetical protein [uncultured Winogradskyella sp.]|uniref:hypothetical protein n=1 Tax=uncultured Winogradskyella sp. TaxID=395353 RepID=UPI002628FA15|nr:hypothetical protein [uncultured Winogradskyella sp.]